MLSINYYLHNLDDEKKDFVKKNIGEKLLTFEKFFKKSTFPPQFFVEAEFFPKKKRYRVELQLKSPLGRLISTAEGKELKSCFDETIDDLSCQLKRQKDKIATLKERGQTSFKKRFSIHHSARFRKTNL